MDLDKFTQKAQEAVLGAQSLTGEYSHGQVEPTHLLLAPLKRVIQREVQDPLALALLRGDFAEGDMVRVDTRDGRRVVFERG
ncbi:MAG: hypothetical protein SWK90_04845 [Chloroflexota bacterium]|nr:hypothetical protein [Chloroflexota bacterium]